MLRHMRPIGDLTGFKVRLRELRRSTDLQKCLAWVNDPEVTRFLKINPPVSEQQEEAFFASAGASGDVVFAIETLEVAFIGTIGLRHIDHANKLATSGTLIGDKNYWGQGFGRDAKMLLLDYAFDTLGLRRVKSSVLEYNDRSLRMNRACGYRQEGVLRQERFKEGRYWDEILLAVMREEWEPIWERYRETGALA